MIMLSCNIYFLSKIGKAQYGGRLLHFYFVSKFWKNDIFSLNIPLSKTGLGGRSGEWSRSTISMLSVLIDVSSDIECLFTKFKKLLNKRKLQRKYRKITWALRGTLLTDFLRLYCVLELLDDILIHKAECRSQQMVLLKNHWCCCHFLLILARQSSKN